jgi:hypothetical protein
LLLWDAEAGEVVGVPEAARPVWLVDLVPNTLVIAQRDEHGRTPTDSPSFKPLNFQILRTGADGGG